MMEENISYYIFSSLPFAVCLTWTVILLLGFKNNDPGKRQLNLFAAVCTVLYFCHAVFFMDGGNKLVDALWISCSLSVYPLFWLYIRSITESSSIKLKAYWLVLPGLSLGIISVFADIEALVKLVFVFTFLPVCIFGYRRLKLYNRGIDNFYSDTHGKSVRPMMELMVLLVLTSFCSGLLNALGREFFAHSLIVIIPSICFSSLLFMIFYNGSRLQYTAVEISDAGPAEADVQESSEDQLMHMISQEMEQKRMFVLKSLKITDLSASLCTNKTYVSNSINNCTGKSFTEYVNGLRIEYAKSLLLDKSKGLTMSEISEEAGFTHETSFYRNFKSFTGKTPKEWIKENSA